MNTRGRALLDLADAVDSFCSAVRDLILTFVDDETSRLIESEAPLTPNDPWATGERS